MNAGEKRNRIIQMYVVEMHAGVFLYIRKYQLYAIFTEIDKMWK